MLVYALVFDLPLFDLCVVLATMIFGASLELKKDSTRGAVKYVCRMEGTIKYHLHPHS